MPLDGGDDGGHVALPAHFRERVSTGDGHQRVPVSQGRGERAHRGPAADRGQDLGRPSPGNAPTGGEPAHGARDEAKLLKQANQPCPFLATQVSDRLERHVEQHGALPARRRRRHRGGARQVLGEQRLGARPDPAQPLLPLDQRCPRGNDGPVQQHDDRRQADHDIQERSGHRPDRRSARRTLADSSCGLNGLGM